MRTLYWFARGLARSVISATSGELTVVGGDKRIHRGGAIIAANHTSYLDPPIVASAYNSPVAFLARKTLFQKEGRHHLTISTLYDKLPYQLSYVEVLQLHISLYQTL